MSLYGCVDKFIESENKIEQLSDPNKVTPISKNYHYISSEKNEHYKSFGHFLLKRKYMRKVVDLTFHFPGKCVDMKFNVAGSD